MCLHTLHATDLIADLSGYYPAGAAYAPNAPERLLETRLGQPTGQKGWTEAAKPAAGRTIELQVTGTGTANLPADTKAVFLNVTTVNTDSPGWLVAYPCGEPRPTAASNVNQLPGLVRSNLVAAKVGAGGKVCLYTYSSTDIVVDLLGSAPAASTFVPTAPERVLETRKSEGQINYSAARPVAGQTVEVKVIGFGDHQGPGRRRHRAAQRDGRRSRHRRHGDGVPLRHARCRWPRTSTSPGSRWPTSCRSRSVTAVGCASTPPA